MAPVVLEKVKPAGREGETAHVTTAPPVEVGVVVDMAIPFVRVNEVDG